MRGKSIDTDFVAAFIQECLTMNKATPEEICEEASRRLDEIDAQLKLRTKLVDVLSHFNYKKKKEEIDKEPVSFTGIDIGMANDILAIVEIEDIHTDTILADFIKRNEWSKNDLIFTLKQLFAADVLDRDAAGIISKGSNFDSWPDFNEQKH